MAVNLRLTEPAPIAMVPTIDPFDGLDTFDDLPRDGKCVADVWAWTHHDAPFHPAPCSGPA